MKDRLGEILGSKDGYNGQNGVWVLPEADYMPRGRQIQFGGVPNAGDENKYQGNPRDLLVLDEAANLLESQARFLMGWVRSTVREQRCRTLMCSNPPTSAEGQWLLEYFAPWLDPEYPNPAGPGELRWFATIDGEDREVNDGRSFILVDGAPCYDFSRVKIPVSEIIDPQSRSFIPSRISDNLFLLHTGYARQLQAMPEPLRSQLLHGDFMAGLRDDAWQVIPSSWVRQAMDRWEERVSPGRMDSMGVDVSRGGRDEAVIARRHGDWYAELEVFPGSSIPDGPKLGAEVLRLRRDASPVHVDVVGVGSSVVDFLNGQGIHVVGISGAESVSTRDKSGRFRFRNKISEGYWLLRESLDPQHNPTIALPPDSQLKADLCARTYRILEGNIIVIESKDRKSVV